jgi:DNA (cytosine-5)-methyltransferase 1
MLKVRTLFSGIGAPEIALRDLQIPFELVDFCEVDKYAVKSYCAVHGVSEEKNLGDITKVWGRNLPYADLLIWGFPCTDISVAGKQAGIIEGETRSGLYYEGLRILKETKPKYSVIENVKNLTGKKFKAEFEQMLRDIEELGYNNYWKVLNAKDYGIPQNRERVFIVSIRKDIDTHTFKFPKGFDNGLRLKDFLEDEVDEKYYISQEKTEKLIRELNKGKGMKEVQEPSGIYMHDSKAFSKDALDGMSRCLKAEKIDSSVVIPCITPDRVEKRQNGRRFKEDGDPMFTITSQDRHGVLQVGNIVDTGNWSNPQRGRIYSPEGCSPALNTCGGGGLEPKIFTENKPVLVGGIGEKNFGKQYRQGNRVYDSENAAMALNASPVGNAGGYSYLYKTGYRIRKLTPKECWRLMGFKDEDFQKAVDAGVSNSQLYKQAGNSIVTNCLFYIFKNLLQAEIAAIYEENKEAY